MNQDAARTVHAQQAMELTDLFSYKFGAQRYGQKVPRRLKLQEPDGPSTAGGKQARQPLVLADESEPPQTMVFGWVDTTQRRCEIRALSALSRQHQQRFGRPIDFEAAEHQRLVEDLRGFLKIQKIEVVEVDNVPSPPPSVQTAAPAAAAAEGASTGMVLGVFVAGVAVGLALGYVLFG